MQHLLSKPHSIIVLHIPIQQSYNITFFQFYNFATLQFYNLLISKFYNFTIHNLTLSNVCNIISYDSTFLIKSSPYPYIWQSVVPNNYQPATAWSLNYLVISSLVQTMSSTTTCYSARRRGRAKCRIEFLGPLPSPVF